MKKNNKIISFLYNYRKVKSINQFVGNFILLLIVSLTLFISAITLERFIFFNSDTRIRIDIFLISFFVSILILFILRLFFQIKGRLINYRYKDIAKEVGSQNSTISDRLLNALQLNQNNFSSELSKDLKNRAIKNIENQIPELNKNSYTVPWKSRSIFILLFIGLISFSMTYNKEFSDSAIRILNPKKTFEIPKPYEILNKFQAHQILEGDSLNIQFIIHSDYAPDSIDIILSDKINKKEISAQNSKGAYEHTIKNVLNDFSYWAEYNSNSIFDPWEKIKSQEHRVEIIKRPRINSIEFIVIPPAYSKLEKSYYSANNTDISMLEGSSINITARANKNLTEAWIESGDDLIPLYTEDNYIKDDITFTSSCNITLLCKDQNKIKNINPPLNKINVVRDNPPQIFISSPDNEFSINDDRLISIDMQTIDDYGVSEAWIEYKIIKPSYLGQDSSVYKHSIDILDRTQKAQRVIYNWDISNHFLAPDDKIEFYIKVADNNNMTGPSIGSAGPFIGKVPSLDDLFDDISNLENQMIDEIEEITMSVDEVYELVDELERDLLKSEEVDWEQEKKISESSDKIDEILNDIENINEMLEQIQEEADKNDLFNQDLIEKFNEFQELLDAIMTDEMLEKLNQLNEKMEQMTTEQMLNEIQNLKQDISMMEEQLDRFIELFQLAMAEQSLDEIVKMLEQMVSQQTDISNDHASADINFDSLLKQEINQINSYQDLEKSIVSSSENIEKFSSKAAKSLEKIISGENAQKAKENMKEAKSYMEKKMGEESFAKSEDIIDDLNALLNDVNSIKDSFNSKMVDEMTVEFINLIRSIEIISFDQELLTYKLNEFPSYSPEIQKVAFSQNVIKNKIIKFIEQMIQVSNKTLHIPPGVNRTIGAAQLSIQKSISFMEQKQIKKDLRSEQIKAIKAINETAYILLTSLDEMQNSMSASGMESYLEQLSKMAESQQKINQGSQQCSNPGFMPGGQGQSIQGELMKRLQKQQEALGKQLGEMIGEMPGDQNSGSLSKAASDMEEVIKDFQRKKITRETINRQEKILSRMLDSQKSLKQKDYNEKRKSKSAETIIYDGPISLPSDKGERQTLLTLALQEALNEEYSNDYQIILKKYFKYLEEQEFDEE